MCLEGGLVSVLHESKSVELTHRVDVVVFLQREYIIVPVALPETDRVCRLRAANHNLLDSEFASDLDHVVRRLSVSVEQLIVRNEHVPGVRGEVDDNVRNQGWSRRGDLVFLHFEERGEGVEDLSAVGQIGLEGVHGDLGIREGDDVEVHDCLGLRFSSTS
jgi:hypothetical protein